MYFRKCILYHVNFKFVFFKKAYGTGRLVSTEVLISGASSWRKVGDLPTVPINGLRGVSINNNTIIMAGNEYLPQLHSDFQQQWRKLEQNWNHAEAKKLPCNQCCSYGWCDWKKDFAQNSIFCKINFKPKIPYLRN